MRYILKLDITGNCDMILPGTGTHPPYMHVYERQIRDTYLYALHDDVF